MFTREVAGVHEDLGERTMSAREVANHAALMQHLEDCRISNQKHLEEMEQKRIADMKCVDPKFAEFWETKRRNTQALRDKAQR